MNKRTASEPDHEQLFIARLLRTETVGGAVVLAVALVALLWANSPVADSYRSLRELQLGPLDLEHWAADAGLALFFYVAGLELKREFTVGSLRRPSRAALPIVAACCGVAVPGAIYLLVNLTAATGVPRGWAIPAATDIAFALAVLALVGSGLPPQLRAFLLTLAVVDDLIVIMIIAMFYPGEFHLYWLLAAAPLLALFALLQRRQRVPWFVYLPVSLAVWWCFLESGVHATIAGVLMGLLTRGLPRTERLEQMLTPWSAGVAVPFFALMSAGVALTGAESSPRSLSDLAANPIAIGIFLGLLVGKPVGILGGVLITMRLRGAELGPGLAWRDLIGLAMLGGVGFTVSLLVSGLAFSGTELETAKTAVLAGSVCAAFLGGLVLRRRGRSYAR